MIKLIKTAIILAIIVYGIVNIVQYISFEMRFGSFKEELRNEIVPFAFKDDEYTLREKIQKAAEKNDIVLYDDSLLIESNGRNEIAVHTGLVDTFYLWFDFYYFPVYKSIDIKQEKSF